MTIMKYACSYVLIWISCMLLSTAPGWTHQTYIRTIEEAVVVKAYYDEANPMSSCRVEVTRPSDSSYLLAGETDQQGIFAFLPEDDGLWVVTVSDGMGHRARIDIEVKDGGAVAEGDEPETGRFNGLIVGVSIIFGLFGIIAIFYRRSGPINRREI